MSDAFINDLEEIEKLKSEESFKNKVSILNKKLEEASERYKDPPYSSAVEFIKNMPDSTEEELNEKEWYWNNGLFRTVEEVNAKEWKEKSWDADGVDELWGLIKFLCFIPVIIDIIVFIYSINHTGDSYITSFFLFLPLLILGFVGCAIVDNIRMAEARNNGITTNDPKYNDVRRSRDKNIFIGASGTIGSIKSTKNSIKKITDVDNWPKL